MPILPDMRRLTALLTLFLVTGVLSAPPASAAFGAVVDLPDATHYSPFGGPAVVTFTFDGAEPASIFTIRLRRPGSGVVREQDVLVDPASRSSPFAVPFSWPDISVDAPTDYVIDVRPQAGGSVVTSEPFTISPRLVYDVWAKPSRFYPLIDDGYRDTTTIRYALAVDTISTTLKVIRPDADGRCCGAAIRTVDLGPRGAGTRRWTWNGTRDDASLVRQGIYFVKLQATDRDAITMTSRASKIEVATGTIRETATKRRVGSAFARTADERQTAIGGDCLVSRDTEAKTAFVLCANAEISLFWKWRLDQGERIERVRFEIDGGSYGCNAKKGSAKAESYLRVTSPPTSTCTVRSASITYSYPVKV